MAIDLLGGGVGREDPAIDVLAYFTIVDVERGHSQIGRASIEVESELLAANSDRGQVFGVE